MSSRCAPASTRRSSPSPKPARQSTAKRTRETVDLALETFGEPCPVATEPRLYLAEATDLLSQLRMTPPFARLLLAVGHNPGFHDLTLMLVGRADPMTRTRLEAGFPTASFAVIEFVAESWADVQPGAGVLDRFVTPADLQ